MEMIFFSRNLLCIVRKYFKFVLLENKAFQLDFYYLEAILKLNLEFYSFQGNTKLYAKYINAIIGY